ncbi:MAG: hypothetical protein AABX03_04470 [Nanoarchaeota archaeon]
MRKIFTKEQVDKRKKRNQILVGIVLIGTMVISTLAYAFFSSDGGSTGAVGEKIKYNGVEFVRNENGYWQYSMEGVSFYSYYSPSETENVNISQILTLNELYNKPLYFVSSNPSASSEITQNLGRYASRYQETCLTSSGVKLGECDENTVEKTCADNIFVFKEANETKVERKDNCLFIESLYSEQVLISDRIIFKTLGIQ